MTALGLGYIPGFLWHRRIRHVLLLLLLLLLVGSMCVMLRCHRGLGFYPNPGEVDCCLGCNNTLYSGYIYPALSNCMTSSDCGCHAAP